MAVSFFKWLFPACFSPISQAYNSVRINFLKELKMFNPKDCYIFERHVCRHTCTYVGKDLRSIYKRRASQATLVIKNQCRRLMRVRSLGWEDPWRKKWQPTPVFLPGESHEERSLAGFRPRGHKRVGHNWGYTHRIKDWESFLAANFLKEEGDKKNNPISNPQDESWGCSFLLPVLSLLGSTIIAHDRCSKNIFIFISADYDKLANILYIHNVIYP